MAPTRFPSGVTNVAQSNPLGMFGAPDPTKYHVWFDDFDDYDASRWVVTSTDGGADSGEVYQVQNADGGIFLVTTNDADNDAEAFQFAGEESSSVVETFTFTSGKKLWFKTRLKVDDALDSDVFAGLYITDTDPVGGLSDGVYFRKSDGDNTVQLIVETSSTETAVDAAEMADDTYIVLGFYYDGDSAIKVYADDVHVGTAATTNLPSTELAVSFMVQAGEAATKTLSMDYLLVAKER